MQERCFALAGGALTKPPCQILQPSRSYGLQVFWPAKFVIIGAVFLIEGLQLPNELFASSAGDEASKGAGGAGVECGLTSTRATRLQSRALLWGATSLRPRFLTRGPENLAWSFLDVE